jgi:hypothetical protein
MMNSVTPQVRHMLLCDDVRVSLNDPRKVNIYGLLSKIRPMAEGTGYPFRHSFCVYLVLTGGRGTGEGRIVLVHADTNEPTYVGQPHLIKWDPDPLKVQAVVFRLPSCEFPQPGLYWVQFRYDDQTLSQQPLEVGEFQ